MPDTPPTNDLDGRLDEITNLETRLAELREQLRRANDLSMSTIASPSQRQVAGLKVMQLEPQVRQLEKELAVLVSQLDALVAAATVQMRLGKLQQRYSTSKVIEARRPDWEATLKALPAYVLAHYTAATTDVTRRKWVDFRKSILDLKADSASSSDVRLAAAEKILRDHRPKLLAEFSANDTVKTEMLRVFLQAIDDLPADAASDATNKAF